jgi:hypothetical protein
VKILKAVGLLKRPKNKPVAIELNPINASRQQKANLKENLLTNVTIANSKGLRTKKIGLIQT